MGRIERTVSYLERLSLCGYFLNMNKLVRGQRVCWALSLFLYTSGKSSEW